ERADWLDLGLALLAKDGPDGLRIEALCAAAQKTKGSFYHHFADHDAFLAALLGHWRELHTDRIIRLVDREPAAARPRVLADIATGADHRIERAIRRLAAVDAQAQAALAAVDTQRLRYLERLNRDDASVPKRDARLVATLEYAAFVGLEILFPDESSAWRRQ